MQSVNLHNIKYFLFIDMIDLIECHELKSINEGDTVIVTKLDRFARNT